MTRRLFALMFLPAVLVGCSDYNPPAMKDPVDIRGKVVLRGAPVSDVMLVLQPAERGYQTNLRLGADGSFTGQAVPGKYMYYFQPIEAKGQAEHAKFNSAFNRVPEANRSPSLERTVSVSTDVLTIDVN